MLVDIWLTVGQCIGKDIDHQLSTKSQPSIGQLWTNHQPSANWLSTKCHPSVDWLSTDISVESTYSKHDPILISSRCDKHFQIRVSTVESFIVVVALIIASIFFLDILVMALGVNFCRVMTFKGWIVELLLCLWVAVRENYRLVYTWPWRKNIIT